MKTRHPRFFVPCLLLPVLFAAVVAARAAELFDGRSLEGWEGDPKWWRVQDGLITGGSLTEKVPRNFFLATTRSFQNFELRLELRLTGVPNTGMINSGVQIRSLRVPESTEMSGYQVDAGDGWWGKLYDESRRNKVIAEPLDAAAVNAAVRPGGWNEYRIRAEGARIRSWINGVPALDYTEQAPRIAQDGRIGIQIHSGGMAQVQVRNVRLDELPPTPGAPKWDQIGHPQPRPPAPAKKAGKAAPKKAAEAEVRPAAGTRDISYNAVNEGPRTAEEERLSFQLPPGFEAELVAAESPGFGKFITVAWDARMRMWSMTALEYPVDGNEQKAASDALFAAGGRDRVVVFDAPYGVPEAGRAAVTVPPRVFADGLVMPLGVLPYKDGAIVQYGADLRWYRDTNGDGRADRHEVILTGFGTQDSHLFPHQFLRQPGDRIFVAQGLFNYSKVRRPDGRAFADGAVEVAFNQCKLGWFAPDGSVFESLTAGPNNIWGLVTSREGETFFQEANDQGFPVIPFEPGVWVTTGSKDRLRPYQPLMPAPLAPAQMGGTGLSGLALAEDADGLFRAFGAPPGADGAKVFFLANPITNTINAVRATPAEGRYRFEKLPDFLTTKDKWFRPVALHFGPDGALYIVDWYNRIISHNEVPRTHPDRDKTRGRIWRIRHRDQPRVMPPDLTRLDDRAVLAHLGGPNALVSRLAWLEITDRRATGLAPELARLAADRAAAVDRRLAALWALEGLQPVSTPLLQALAADPRPRLRREAARLAAASSRPEAEFLAVVTPLAADPHPSVRAAVGDALRRVSGAGIRVMAVAAQLGRAPLPDAAPWPRYEREFERYLARWALEVNRAATRALLDSPEGRALPVEARALATLALGGKEAALGLARLASGLGRPLGDEEVRVLAAHFAEPAVAAVLGSVLRDPGSRVSALRALLALRPGPDIAAVLGPLSEAASALLGGATASEVVLAAELAGGFRLTGLAGQVAEVLRRDLGATPPTLAALRALRELGVGPVDLLERVAREAANPAAREEAVAALGSVPSAEAIAGLLRLVPALPPRARGIALDRLAGTPAGADALIAAVTSGAVAPGLLDLGCIERLRVVRPEDPRVAAWWRERNGAARRALRLPGGHEDFMDTRLTLAGAFTLEAWLKLDPGINQRDGLAGAPGQFDLNFFDGRFRVWLPDGNDVIVATKRAVPGVWVHYAVTRDAKGIFRLYLDGELNGTSAATVPGTFTEVRLGRTRTDPAGGVTGGWLDEYRVWTVARTAEGIRESFDRTFADLPADRRPPGLAQVFSGAGWGLLAGAARSEVVEDAPVLLTQAEAAAQAEKFARFRGLANAAGEPGRGRELFAAICLACHQQGGQGGQIAPALDGVGHTGVEALLRNLLTPSAAMESAYQTFRVVTKDGAVTDAFLVEESAEAVLVRQPGAADRRIARAEIRQAGYLRRSLMPEGLLEGMAPGQVSDLFAYLKSLR
jgi:putative heme-binding domain-containing protein